MRTMKYTYWKDDNYYIGYLNDYPEIQRLPLRAVWSDEARDFTQWLQENLDVLNEVSTSISQVPSVSRERAPSASTWLQSHGA